MHASCNYVLHGWLACKNLLVAVCVCGGVFTIILTRGWLTLGNIYLEPNKISATALFIAQGEVGVKNGVTIHKAVWNGTIHTLPEHGMEPCLHVLTQQ